MTNVVIQQYSRKLLMMDILMSETCCAHKKLIKIASDIKLVFSSSSITMMHDPINIRLRICFKSTSSLILAAAQLKERANFEFLLPVFCMGMKLGR